MVRFVGWWIVMTTGNVLKSIIRFAIPCIGTRVIQNLYPLIDAVIAGKLLNVESLSAVGVAGSVYSLFNDTLLGLMAGFAVVASKKFGAKEENEVRAVYSDSLWVSVLCCVITSLIGIVFSGSILSVLKTPADIMVYGKQYLFVLFLGFLSNALYNFFCEMMRALGDSKRPLYLLIASSVLHFLLIAPLTYAFGIYGAALANVLSYILTDIWAVMMMRNQFPLFRVRLSKIALQRRIVKECISIGLPMALTSLVVMMGVLLLNLVTNTIGADYIAAYSAASKIGYVITTPIFGFATALAVFTSQNFGAKRYNRIQEGIRKTLKLVWLIDGALLVLVMLLCKPILQFILSGNQTAIQAGIVYLAVRCCAMFILTPAAFYKSLLPAVGRPLFSTVSGFVEIGARYAFPLCAAGLGFISVPLTDAVAWIVLAVMLVLAYRYEFKKIRKGTV